MKVLVLGGLGLQGKAALLDLARSEDVEEVVCADVVSTGLESLARFADLSKVRMAQVDASSKPEVVSLLRQGVDAAIDLLPLPLMRTAFEAAIEVGVPLVSTNYAKTLRDLDSRAAAAGVSLMPECGLDPGIDLVLFGHAVKQFDQLDRLDSYCGGIPEKAACDNPLSYKISWNWDMVLRTQQRDSVFILEGRRLEIPAAEQHETELIHTIHFPGLGELEAVPNGDAVFYTDLLGVTATIRQAGRYFLRWPGWCAFWRPLKRLGFLSDARLSGLEVSPRQFLVRLMQPQLQYRDDEKDLVVMHNVFQGIANGRRKTVVTNLLVERDLKTGLFAMNTAVGCPASIVAQMLGRRQIARKGLLNPAVDVPPEPFMAELSRRGIMVNEEVTWES
jgi:saccharopine dehydrogenase-like NADP-dependent oxidoreductase